MKARKTLTEILDEREIALPNPFLYYLLFPILRLLHLPFHPRYYYHFDKKQMRGRQVILLSDHASFDTFYYTLAGYPFVPLSAVMGYHHFFKKFLFGLFVKMGVIAKRNYETDLRAVRQMFRVLTLGGSLCLFPEGVRSTTGSNHPINPSTAAMLKKLGVTVVLCKTYGSYCARPLYCSYTKKGRQEYHYEILFTPEELQTLTDRQVYEKLLSRFRYNDFRWNAKMRYRYTGKTPNAENADTIVYLCPKCRKEFTLQVEGDTICCTACGNRVRMNESYQLEPVGEDSTLVYSDLDAWYKAQRRLVRQQIREPSFSLSYDCELVDMYTDKTRLHPYYTCGEGRVTIERSGVRYAGTRCGEQVELFFPIEKIPSFLFTPGKNNVLYYHNTYYCFCPKQDKKKVVKYLLAVEELHNAVDPVWAQVSADAYESEEEVSLT